jgi:hypothetical protein
LGTILQRLAKLPEELAYITACLWLFLFIVIIDLPLPSTYVKVSHFLVENDLISPNLNVMNNCATFTCMQLNQCCKIVCTWKPVRLSY